MWPDNSADSHIKNRIYKKLHQKAGKYRAGKLSDSYMRKYLVKSTTLDWFQVNDVIKLLKTEPKMDIYDIFNRVVPRRPQMLRETIIDVDQKDYNNFREKHEKERKD